jgi:multidrug efflux pump subunit AcrB
MGLIFMFLILVLEFKNIRYPFLIISSTILSIAGGLFFLFLFGYSFSFPAQLGMFGVIGV